MIRKTTILVLLIAVALGAAVYYFEWKRSQTGEATPDTSKPAFTVSGDQVRSLTLTRGADASASIRVEKRGGAWRIVRPIEADADPVKIEGIVDEIVGARVSQTESGSPDRRKAFGLDPPQASVEFETQDGARHTIVFGSQDFTGTSVYALIDGGPNAALLPADLSTSADTPVSDLRDKRVVHMDAVDVQRVEIHNANGTIIASRKKDAPEEWVIEVPEGLKGKSAAGWKILDAISGLRAEEMIDRPAPGVLRQMAAPAVRAVLAGKDGKQYSVHISKPAGDFVYARAGDGAALYKLKKQVLENWNWRAADLTR